MPLENRVRCAKKATYAVDDLMISQQCVLLSSIMLRCISRQMTHSTRSRHCSDARRMGSAQNDVHETTVESRQWLQVAAWVQDVVNTLPVMCVSQKGTDLCSGSHPAP